MVKMTKMKPSERFELTAADAKGKMHCRDYFGGFLKRDGFLRTMRDFPYTDPALDETYEPTFLYPTLPGTATAILDWAVGCGYIEQADQDEIMKGLENGTDGPEV